MDHQGMDHQGMDRLPAHALDKIASQLEDANLKAVGRAAASGPGLSDLAEAAARELANRPRRRAALRTAVAKTLRASIRELVGRTRRVMHAVEEVKGGRQTMADIVARTSRPRHFPAGMPAAVAQWVTEVRASSDGTRNFVYPVPRSLGHGGRASISFYWLRHAYGAYELKHWLCSCALYYDGAQWRVHEIHRRRWPPDFPRVQQVVCAAARAAVE